MTDLVMRLRAAAAEGMMGGDHYQARYQLGANALCAEAADRIDLQAKQLGEFAERSAADIEHLRVERDAERARLVPLACMFRKVWDYFLDGGSIDGAEVQDMIEATGLAAWREATEEDVDKSNLEIEVGDPLLFLNEEGKRILALGGESRSLDASGNMAP